MTKHDKNRPIHPIGKVAERLNVSVEIIRLYERRGLILVTKTEGISASFLNLTSASSMYPHNNQ